MGNLDSVAPALVSNAATGTPLPILMYHSVPSGGAGTPLAVPRDRVREQWRALVDDGWRLTGMTQALAIKERHPNARVVALTFDDALADFGDVPDLLAEVGASATVYVPTALVGASAESMKYAGTVLDWARLEQLPESVEIGSHGHRHLPLDLFGRRPLAQELRLSADLIATHTGRRPTAFCYPHGYAGRSTRQAVRDAGYTSACIIGRRLAQPGVDDPMALPRLHVLPEHDGRGIVAAVRADRTPIGARIRDHLQPGWRLARRSIYRTTRVVLT